MSWGQLNLVNVPKEIIAKKLREREKYTVKKHLKSYLSDFYLMSNCRQNGMNGPQPIQMQDMYNMFFTSTVFRGTSYRKYLRFQIALDRTYLNHYYENKSK